MRVAEEEEAEVVVGQVEEEVLEEVDQEPLEAVEEEPWQLEDQPHPLEPAEVAPVLPPGREVG